MRSGFGMIHSGFLILAMALAMGGGPRPAAAQEAPSVKAAKPVILTPPAPETPRINGARVFGVRPGRPFLFTIPATGRRPMTFKAEGLPQGLSLDPATGRITGVLEKPGPTTVTLTAENALGKATRELRIVCGDAICLTPPLGWNSWNCWGKSVDEAKVRAAAKAMADSGLINHGWTFVNIDDGWQGKRGGTLGAILGNEKFPNMKGLCDDVHALGLKIGIYSTPWFISYAGFTGGSSGEQRAGTNPSATDLKRGRYFGATCHAAADAKQWAEWGMDYLKYDWRPWEVPDVEAMTDALKASGRDIVYSLSNRAPFELVDKWVRLANCWRTTGDIVDTWKSVSEIGFAQGRWTPHAGPGHWNDPDMLVVGNVGWGPKLHPTRLTPDEQTTHISLWCLLSAPLLIGCDMADMDEFTLSLLTNDEVLALDQDPLGKQAALVAKPGDGQVWAKDLEDGSKAVGLFNLGAAESKVEVKWSDLGLSGKRRARDLWRQKDLGEFADAFSTPVPSHGVVLIRIY